MKQTRRTTYRFGKAKAGHRDVEEVIETMYFPPSDRGFDYVRGYIFDNPWSNQGNWCVFIFGLNDEPPQAQQFETPRDARSWAKRYLRKFQRSRAVASVVAA